MATRKRLKTETQLITRKNNERAYAQTLHSILFLSGNIVSGDKSANMMRNVSHNADTLDFQDVYQYEDAFMQEDGSIRREFYNALVMDDCIHIKISFIQEWNEKPSEDNGQGIGTVEVHMPNYSVKGEIRLDSPTEPDSTQYGSFEEQEYYENEPALCTPNGNHK